MFAWLCCKRTKQEDVPPHLNMELIPRITPKLALVLRNEIEDIDSSGHFTAYSTYTACKCSVCRDEIDPSGEFQAMELVQPFKQMRFEAIWSYNEYKKSKEIHLNENSQMSRTCLMMAQRKYFLESINYIIQLNELRNVLKLPNAIEPEIDDFAKDIDPYLAQAVQYTKQTNVKRIGPKAMVGGIPPPLSRTISYVDNSIRLFPFEIFERNHND